MWNLFLDDLRDVDYVKGDGRKYVLCRTMAAALNMIHLRGLPTHIAFDHDLGWEQLDKIPGSFLLEPPRVGKEMPSGFDFAKWLVEGDLNRLFDIPKSFTWSIHSSNPVGAENINGLLTGYMKSKYGI